MATPLSDAARVDAFNDFANYPGTKYVRATFEETDRLAVVVRDTRTGATIQRVAPAANIAHRDTQKWLRFMNAQRCEIYVGMNPLRPDARRRTKRDIDTIRHIYLDLDDGGEARLAEILHRRDLPEPNFVLTSSPGKYQVIWRADGFTPAAAEALQRALVRDVGADVAATDVTRVLRLPGFYNHKYARPHYVRAQPMSQAVYGPAAFPQYEDDTAPARMGTQGVSRLAPPPGGAHVGPDRSPSGKDWSFALRALARGEEERRVIDAIVAQRSGDKPRPRDYATRTVQNAAEHLKMREPRER